MVDAHTKLETPPLGGEDGVGVVVRLGVLLTERHPDIRFAGSRAQEFRGSRHRIGFVWVAPVRSRQVFDRDRLRGLATIPEYPSGR
jgi:hypothetical protein